MFARLMIVLSIVHTMADQCEVQFGLLSPVPINFVLVKEMERYLAGIPRKPDTTYRIVDLSVNSTLTAGRTKETEVNRLAHYYYGMAKSSTLVALPMLDEESMVEVKKIAHELRIPVISSVWSSRRQSRSPDTLFVNNDSGYVVDVAVALLAFFRVHLFTNIALLCHSDEKDIFLRETCDFSVIHLRQEMLDIVRIGISGDRCTAALQKAAVVARAFVFMIPDGMLKSCLEDAEKLGLSDGTYVFVSVKSPTTKSTPFTTASNTSDASSITSPNLFAQLFILASNNPATDDIDEMSKKLTKSKINPQLFASSEELLVLASVQRNLDAFSKVLEQEQNPKLMLTNSANRNTWNCSNPASYPLMMQNMQSSLLAVKRGATRSAVTFQRIVLIPETEGNFSTTVFAEFDPIVPQGLNIVMDRDIFIPTWPGWVFPPPNVPVCGFRNDADQCQPADNFIMAIIAAPCILIFIGLFLLYKQNKAATYENTKPVETTQASVNQFEQLDPGKWEIKPEELRAAMSSAMTKSLRALSRMSVNASFIGSTTTKIEKLQPEVHVFMGHNVWVKERELSYSFIPEDETLAFIHKARRLNHASVAQFLGVVLSSDPLVYEIKIVMDFYQRGSLQDLIGHGDVDFAFPLKAVFIRDIVTAMTFVHSSFIGCHGSLKSPNCLITERFTVKITDYGLNVFPVHPPAVEADEYLYHGLLWTAPEILRGPIIRVRKGTKEGDMYSYAIIMQEILTQTEPYYDFKTNSALLPKEVVHLLIQKSAKPHRPEVPPDKCSPELMALLRTAWAENPVERPTFKALGISLDRTPGFGHKQTYLDYILGKMEEYNDELEHRVRTATSGLLDEKKKSEEILAQMLPKVILEKFKRGIIIEPESYDHVTLGITAIINFAMIAHQSTPYDIVAFLNELFIKFDAVIDNFDVYKVETIQDSYVIASGLPDRNGRAHAAEIGYTSLDMLDTVSALKIKHMDSHLVEMKVGIHTGIIAAGVIGLKAPRYCLFGDTINTASRMCSSGEAQRIQITESTKNFIEENDKKKFDITFRGEAEVKGKGKMRTFYINRLPKG